MNNKSIAEQRDKELLSLSNEQECPIWLTNEVKEAIHSDQFCRQQSSQSISCCRPLGHTGSVHITTRGEGYSVVRSPWKDPVKQVISPCYSNTMGFWECPCKICEGKRENGMIAVNSAIEYNLSKMNPPSELDRKIQVGCRTMVNPTR